VKTVATLDPVTIEIIQSRLMQIGHEGGLVLQRCAVSPTVVEAHDLGFNIADHQGRTVVYSTWMPRHGTTLAYMLEACKRRFGDDVRPGDMYLVNDPHSGALHILDLAVIAPVHVDGTLVGWVANATHHVDVGAMTPGRAPLATSSHQEGILFRPTRLVEDGRLREDIFGLFLDNVRMPRYQALDLKGQVSANLAASSKVVALARRYGVERLRAAYDAILDLSEAKARERIAELPEGRYEAVEQLDFDRHYTLRCALDVVGDELRFDFSGTDPEARTFVNSALACTVANLHNIVACQLLPDIAPNAGAFRAVSVHVPEGSLLNCRPGAPCSGASTITGWKTQLLTIATLTQALARSQKHAHRAMARWGWGFTDAQWTGVDPEGRWYSVRGDATMQGGGAREGSDGIDVANIAGSTNTALASVESYEQRYPVLYLHRGLEPDSEGAGERRGGLAGSWSRILYGVSEAESLPWYMGRDFGAEGFAGGLAGRPALMAVKHGSDVGERLREGPPRYDEVAGREVVLPQQSPTHPFRADDVVYVRGMGGGGYGDPTRRDPRLVAVDVADGLVSAERARSVYAVVVDASGRLDESATAALRTTSASTETAPSA
jgi:N-methylhydantoinase B